MIDAEVPNNKPKSGTSTLVLVEVSPNAQDEEIVDITVSPESTTDLPKILVTSEIEFDMVCYYPGILGSSY